MFGTLVSNVVILIIIFKHVHSQEQRAIRIRIWRVSVSIQNLIQLCQNGSVTKSSTPSRRLSQKTKGNIPSRGEGSDVSSGVLAKALEARSHRNRSSRRLVSKMFLWRAFWFAAAFIFCYGTNFVVQILIIAGRNPKSIPYGVRLWARIIRPLQGFFNILIFTYQHTKNKMKEEPDLSYISALMKVICSGCDNDASESMNNRRSRLQNSTLRNERKFQKKPKQTFGDDSTSRSERNDIHGNNDKLEDITSKDELVKIEEGV